MADECFEKSMKGIPFTPLRNVKSFSVIHDSFQPVTRSRVVDINNTRRNNKVTMRINSAARSPVQAYIDTKKLPEETKRCQNSMTSHGLRKAELTQTKCDACQIGKSSNNLMKDVLNRAMRERKSNLKKDIGSDTSEKSQTGRPGSGRVSFNDTIEYSDSQDLTDNDVIDDLESPNSSPRATHIKSPSRASKERIRRNRSPGAFTLNKKGSTGPQGRSPDVYNIQSLPVSRRQSRKETFTSPGDTSAKPAEHKRSRPNRPSPVRSPMRRSTAPTPTAISPLQVNKFQPPPINSQTSSSTNTKSYVKKKSTKRLPQAALLLCLKRDKQAKISTDQPNQEVAPERRKRANSREHPFFGAPNSEADEDLKRRINEAVQSSKVNSPRQSQTRPVSSYSSAHQRPIMAKRRSSSACKRKKSTSADKENITAPIMSYMDSRLAKSVLLTPGSAEGQLSSPDVSKLVRSMYKDFTHP